MCASAKYKNAKSIFVPAGQNGNGIHKPRNLHGNGNGNHKHLDLHWNGNGNHKPLDIHENGNHKPLEMVIISLLKVL